MLFSLEAGFPVEPARLRRRPARGRTPLYSANSGGRLKVCVLGSGSGGNCTVVQDTGDGGRFLLIDAGFGPRTTARRLRQARVELADVRAICLTHLDQDHFRPQWARVLAEQRIHVHLHHWHLADLLALPGMRAVHAKGLVHPFDGQPFAPLAGTQDETADGIGASGDDGGLRATPIHLAHDLKGTAGFLLDSAHGRLGYATDLGCVPEELIARFAGVDVLALESNYDPQMQLKSDRPWFLKRRIMGQAGHLSNQQAFEAVRKIVDRSPRGWPRRIVLLHRSRQCNHPTLVRQVFAQDARLPPRLILAEQRRRTRWITLRPAAAVEREQMRLF